MPITPHLFHVTPCLKWVSIFFVATLSALALLNDTHASYLLACLELLFWWSCGLFLQCLKGRYSRRCLRPCLWFQRRGSVCLCVCVSIGVQKMSPWHRVNVFGPVALHLPCSLRFCFVLFHCSLTALLIVRFCIWGAHPYESISFPSLVFVYSGKKLNYNVFIYSNKFNAYCLWDMHMIWLI